MKCILISHLKQLQLSQNLTVHNPKVVIDGLIEYHVVDDLVDLFANCSNLFDTILIDVLQKSVDLFMRMDFVNEFTEELNKILIFEVDAKEEAVEKGHGIRFNVVGMLDDALDDIIVQISFSILSSINLLPKPICFFKPICNFMMEINLCPEDIHIVFLNLFLLFSVFLRSEVLQLETLFTGLSSNWSHGIFVSVRSHRYRILFFVFSVGESFRFHVSETVLILE